MKHECLTLQTIRLDKEGVWKVADPVASGALPNYEAVFNSRDCEEAYLSPEQC